MARLGAVETIIALVGVGSVIYGLLRKLHVVGGEGTLSFALIVIGIAAIIVALVTARKRDGAKDSRIRELEAAQERREAEARVRGIGANIEIHRRAGGPIETAILTKEEKRREVHVSQTPVAVRFSPGAHGPTFKPVIADKAPCEIDVGGGGTLIVQAFTSFGVILDEQETYGQTIELECYTAKQQPSDA
jgi:hypothetical protein